MTRLLDRQHSLVRHSRCKKRDGRSGAAGARDFTDYPAFMRTAVRSSLKANYTVPNVGFRCARSIPDSGTLPKRDEGVATP